MTGPLGIVVIGRNEGERLVRCLASVRGQGQVVYVDSGSTDASVANAARAGATVVELDMAIPFTAARARNAGRAALGDEAAVIQFVDGDCTLRPGWLDAGRAALAADPGLAAVFGRCRETAPEASRYNWLCDVEWAVVPGEVRYFAGNAMLRAAALDESGGYPEGMVAGEEPDLSIRMRERGWRIACLPAEMVLHDAAITRFGQWWKRSERSGHAYAELYERHRGSPAQDYGRRLRGAIGWTLIAIGGVAALALATLWPPAALAGALLLALPVLQFARLTRRERARPLRDATRIAAFLMLAKPAQTIGAARYAVRRLRGGKARLFEYKAMANSRI